MASSRLDTLTRRIAEAKARAKMLRARGKVAAARAQDRIAERLEAQLVRGRARKGDGVRVEGRGPVDSKAGLPITPENAAAMVVHYRALVRKAALFSKARQRFGQRLAEARKVYKLALARSRGMARRRPGDKKNLRPLIKQQKLMAEKFRQRRDYAAAARVDATVETLERRQALEDGGVAYEAPSDVASEYVQSAGGRGRPSDELPDGPEGEDDTDLMLGDEEPAWYKRPIVWFGGLGLLAAAVALSRRKGGSKVVAFGAPRAARVRRGRPMAFSTAP